MPRHQWSLKSRLVAAESQISQLELLSEYGEAAWKEDLDQMDSLIAQLGEFKQIEENRNIPQINPNPQTDLISRDLYNYVWNNEKIKIEIHKLDAKNFYEDLKSIEMTTPEIDKLASQLLQ
jgi:hypothetical protein